jgi:cyclopropane fatty-acyl-phospholipid synthase-like methyltransferase
MNSSESETDYWVYFWNHNSILDEEDMQKQVGRTIDKVPINPDQWRITVSEIIKTIELDSNDEIIDICSGNGLLSVPFAEKCKHVTAVDISTKLLDRIDTIRYANITKNKADVRLIQFETRSFSKAVLYFALQHFTERETVLLFKSVYNWLKPDGLFFLGDILDIDKKFVFFKTPELQSAYFESLLTKRAIGTWFSKPFLEKLAFFVGFKKCKILEQPPFQINAHYRFDVLLEK